MSYVKTRASVPCDGCTACCHGLVFLGPHDDPSRYKTAEALNPLTGKRGLALQRKPDGSCVYLGDKGCTIHATCPSICREFDCRVLYASYSRAGRRRIVATGQQSQAVFDAGRERLLTFEK